MKRDMWLSNSEYRMEDQLPGSIHVELKVNEPEILDIETGEMIYLNGYNNETEIEKLSFKGEIFLDNQDTETLNIHSYLDSEL